MIQVIMKPEMHKFATCKEFVEEFKVGEGDVILTNQWIFDPFFGEMGLKSTQVLQEKFGAGEPTDEMVAAIVAEVRKANAKRIIAIGGGTIIDIAKVLAVAGNETIDELYAKMPNLDKKRELIIIPTTCGTGSEVTNIAVLNRLKMGTKQGLVSPKMYADYAVLIPELLQKLPLGVFATSSIDALVHAVESSLSPKATDYTKMFGYKAIEMIINGYKKIVADGLDTRVALMDEFLTASNYAGIAFGTAGCGTVHAMAYPLGGTYHVAHGESNYAMFTGVMKKYMEQKTDGEIAVMNNFLAKLLECDVKNVYTELEELLNNILPKKALHEYGVKEEELPEFAKSVIDNQQRLLGNAFVPQTYDTILDIFKSLY